MVRFDRLTGPYGIPVYFQPLPGLVNSVSVRWVVPVGAADDESVGGQGLYHWFEHVPFRGTKKYPGGYADTSDRFARYGGKVGAHTGLVHTAFHALVPKRFWREALDLVTDLVAQPLMIHEAINAEREIIFKELTGRLSKANTAAFDRIWSLLWEGHPLGHSVVGSEATVGIIDPDALRHAHEAGYARSRCVLFVAGDIEQQALLDAVAECVEVLPDRLLSERRAPIKYGPLPIWKGGDVLEVETSFPSSIVWLLFPISERDLGIEQFRTWTALTQTFTAGRMSSPVMRILREERKLVYEAEADCVAFPDGGFWGLFAETKAQEIPAVCDAFWDVLRDPQPVSSDWHEYVNDSLRSTRDMRVVDPHEYTDEGENRLLDAGQVLSDDEFVQQLTSVSLDEITSVVESLTRERSRLVIFRGMGTTE